LSEFLAILENTTPHKQESLVVMHALLSSSSSSSWSWFLLFVDDARRQFSIRHLYVQCQQ